MEKLTDFILGVNTRLEKAFEHLFNAFYRELVYFSFKLNNSVQDSEDIVHDVMITLWESNYQFENNQSLRSFLYTAVKNRTYNHIKREKKLSNNISHLEDKADESKIEKSIIETELLSILNLAINELPTECKKIMSHLVAGKSCVEISIIMNLAASTVRAQKKRGLTLLKEKLPKELFSLLCITI